MGQEESSEGLEELVSESSTNTFDNVGVELSGEVGCANVALLGIGILGVEGGVAEFIRTADDLRGINGSGAPAVFEFLENERSMLGDILSEVVERVAIIRRWT